MRRPRLLDQGIAPVPPALRQLGLLDNVVLWASLSVGLLVLVTGSFLVPALGVGPAFGAIGLGSALGGLIVAAIAWLGASTRVPGMVLLRAPLGLRGSFAPTILNVAQNFGWTVFEVIVIAQAAHAAVGGAVSLWTVVATAVVIALSLGGPLVVVRRVLRAVGVPIVVVAGLYLTVWCATRLHWHAADHGRGGLTFWLGVDLAIAVPISWAPLVADYSRFARTPRGALLGAALGTTFANAWFYMLGALAVLVGAADPAFGLRPSVGVLVLGLLALAESDKPFADLYSTVVSVQNLRPRWSAPLLAACIGLLVGAVALSVKLTDYESFLFLLGSFFVPLAGVLLCHALRLGSYATAELYASSGRYGTVNPWTLTAWLAGFAVYQWIAPTPVHDWLRFVGWLERGLHAPAAPSAVAQFGASIPSFLVSAGIVLIVARLPAIGSRAAVHAEPATASR
jgi:NCS1 family nucleobase:cation symporter-1